MRALSGKAFSGLFNGLPGSHVDPRHPSQAGIARRRPGTGSQNSDVATSPQNKLRYSQVALIALAFGLVAILPSAANPHPA